MLIKLKLKEAESFEDIVEKLRVALISRYGSGVENYWVYIPRTETDSVIYSLNGSPEYWKTAYTLSEDGVVKLTGDPERVEEKFTPAPVSESISLQFTEASESTGRTWGITVIEAGTSKNGNYYSPTLLRRSVAMFEGVRAYARSDEDHINSGVKDDINALVGVVKNAEWSEGHQAIIADFVFTGSAKAQDLMNNIKSAWELGVHDFVGLSIVAEGQGTRINGKQTIESFSKINSVDIVANPSAGGRFLELKEANTRQKQEVIMDRQEMLLALREAKIKVNDDISDKDLKSLFAESINHPKPEAQPDNSGIVVSEAKKSQEEAAKLLAEAKKSQEEAAKIAETMRISQSDNDLDARLNKSKLPKVAQALVRQQFVGKLFEADRLDATIKEFAEAFTETVGNLDYSSVSLGANERDKVLNALDGFFNNVDGEIDGNKIPRFKSFKEAYITITGDKYMTGILSEATNLKRLSESIQSSDWSQILGDSITRRMIKEYASPDLSDWRKIVSDINSISDFRSNRRMRMGGYGALPAVSEQATYTALTSPGDEEATYSISKRGGLEDITMEMIANDDVGSIRRIPVKLARTAGITLYRFVLDFIKDNSTATYDSVALFHADHGNLGSAALTASSLLTAKIAMGDQTAYGESRNFISPAPKYILVPLELEDTAFRLTTSAVAIGATNNGATEPNLHSTYGLEPLVVPYWTDANDWALVCDPTSCPTFEIGFFNGQEEPELFVQDQPNVGSMFTADKITYKIRHIYGGAILNHRGMYKAVVA